MVVKDDFKRSQPADFPGSQYASIESVNNDDTLLDP